MAALPTAVSSQALMPGQASTLRALIDTARAAWPGIDVPEDAFVELLLARSSEEPARPLSALPATDLWLALACARGDARALRELEARTFPGARSALRRMGLSADAIAEALQTLRERLLVAEPGESPRILVAANHGNLPAVVRVAAVRTALNLHRRDHRLVGDDAVLLSTLCSDDDPELDALKEQHRAAFKSALESALADLTAHERNLLRLHLLHAVSIDAIGRTYDVHRATAARWLAAVREKLDRETRRRLRDRLGLTDPDVDSLVRLVESRIDVSFRRLLGSGIGDGVAHAEA